MPTNGFRSSGESTFGTGVAVTSKRVGRTFLIGLGTSCGVTMTSRMGDLTSAGDAGVRSTMLSGAALLSAEALRRFSSTDAIRDDDGEMVGSRCGELVTSLLSGRLNERRASPRSAATPSVTWQFINISITC